jgi:hypothetical protein
LVHLCLSTSAPSPRAVPSPRTFTAPPRHASAPTPPTHHHTSFLRPKKNWAENATAPPTTPAAPAKDHRRGRPGSPSSPSEITVVVQAAIRGRRHPVATAVRGRRCRPGSSSEPPSRVASIRSPPPSRVAAVDVEVSRPVPTGVQPVRRYAQLDPSRRLLFSSSGLGRCARVVPAADRRTSLFFMVGELRTSKVDRFPHHCVAHLAIQAETSDCLPPQVVRKILQFCFPIVRFCELSA